MKGQNLYPVVSVGWGRGCDVPTFDGNGFVRLLVVRVGGRAGCASACVGDGFMFQVKVDGTAEVPRPV